MKHYHYIFLIAVLTHLIGCTKMVYRHAKGIPQQEITFQTVSYLHIGTGRDIFICTDTGRKSQPVLHHLTLKEENGSAYLLRQINSKSTSSCKLSAYFKSNIYPINLKATDVSIVKDFAKGNQSCFPENLDATLDAIIAHDHTNRTARKKSHIGYKIDICNQMLPGFVINLHGTEKPMAILHFRESDKFYYERKPKPWLYPLLIITAPLDVALLLLAVAGA